MAQFMRFHDDSKKYTDRKLPLTVCAFLLILSLFYLGVSSVSDSADRRSLENLQNALHNSVVHYYALEGQYPPNLKEIIDGYGLIYDQDRYYIDYRPQDNNLFPDITIIDLQEVH